MLLTRAMRLEHANELRLLRNVLELHCMYSARSLACGDLPAATASVRGLSTSRQSGHSIGLSEANEESPSDRATRLPTLCWRRSSDRPGAGLKPLDKKCRHSSL